MKIVPNTYNDIYFITSWDPDKAKWYLKRLDKDNYCTYYVYNNKIGPEERSYEHEEVKERFKSGNWIKV